MAYKHTVEVNENATSVSTPAASSSGLQVVIGTAPASMADDPSTAVNEPKLCYSFSEAAAAVGYCTDFANYTLCESIYAAFQVASAAPIVLINVLDPAKHKKSVSSAPVEVVNHVATIDAIGVIKSSLVVSNGDAAMTAGTDYTVSFDSDGKTLISLISTSTAYSAATLKVTYDACDPSAVTASDIIGGYDSSTGKETGIELVRQVYPKFGLVPGFILAPHWSRQATVAAALNAKAQKLNGGFRATAVIDVDVSKTKSYTDVEDVKESQGVSGKQELALWPNVKIGDYILDYSAVYAAIEAQADSENSDVPARKVSSVALGISAAVLDDGTEVNLDTDQAAVLNGEGIVTAINAGGWKTWGNNTAAYPGTTDPKDRWITCRRMFNFIDNNLILTYWDSVDDPTDMRLVDNCVNVENAYLNSLASAGKIYGGAVSYDSADNPLTQILDGHVKFRVRLAALIPAEYIEVTTEFDTSIVEEALNGGNA